MWIVWQADNSHEISRIIFYKNIKNESDDSHEMSSLIFSEKL